MSNSLYVVRPQVLRDKYGELLPSCTWEVTYFCQCVDHYPTSSKETIETIGGTNGFEGTKQLETAWIETCRCGTRPCDTDISEGYYAYINNKYWKIIGVKVYDNCNCPIIKLTMERLTPRETERDLIECVSCFKEKPCNSCGG